jgi:hypothetical protein
MIALTGQNHANNTTLPTLPARNSAAPSLLHRDDAIWLCDHHCALEVLRGRHTRDWLLAVLTHTHTHTPTHLSYFFGALFSPVRSSSFFLLLAVGSQVL